jgi:hypothetical protein
MPMTRVDHFFSMMAARYDGIQHSFGSKVARGKCQRKMLEECQRKIDKTYLPETIDPTPGRKMFNSKQMAAHAFVMWGTF